MLAFSMAVAAVLHGVAAAAFLVVARTLAQREVVPEDRLAARAFVVWWAALGSYMALRGVLAGYAALAEPALVVFLVARAVLIPLLVVAVWGLVFHILYVYIGRAALAVPLGVFYAAIGVAFLVAGYVPLPGSVMVEPWYVALEGEGESTLYRVVYAILGLSILASALGYLTVLPKITDRLQRLRVVLVAGSIFLWVASGLGAFLSAGDVAKFVVLVFFGLATAACVLVAYHPPRGVVAWARGEWPALREKRRREARRRAAVLV